MLPRIVTILFPLFAIASAGFLYGRRHKPDMTFANRLNMDVFVPALVFAALADKSVQLTEYLPLALGTFTVIAGSGLAAWAMARFSHLQPRTFVPPMMFNNCGNLGLPLTVLAFGESALPAAVVMFLVSNLMHFSIGAYMLDHNTRFVTLWRVPLLIAAAAGIAVSVSGVALWPPLVLAIRMLGDISVPLLLFSLGVRLTDASFRGWGIGVLGATFRPVVGMLLAWLAARALHLEARQEALLVVFGALPPAVLNYVFAERYRQEPERVASIVLLGNLAALVFLPLALGLAFR